MNTVCEQFVDYVNLYKEKVIKDGLIQREG